ncbi:hypothetical protein IEQ34_026443 [Dendrobium chrysotoxum]|uniref:Uncharacterized protein n=1 Tax=Dendrobium chrysotoxum TaxID=161865 RepID=A0AAV7FIM7_DENCH|nr:hypothetical protein IEQ34_026443 [Dendrobium chrysotoxum]
MLEEIDEEMEREEEEDDPIPLLYLHPSLDPPTVALRPPPIQIQHHHARVEVARPATASLEGQAPPRPLPERGSEVAGEIGVAVLRRRHGGGRGSVQGGGCGVPEVADVVDDQNVGVEIDDAADARGEEITEIVAGVVQGCFKGGPDRTGDEPAYAIFAEPMGTESERWKYSAHRGSELVA